MSLNYKDLNSFLDTKMGKDAVERIIQGMINYKTIGRFIQEAIKSKGVKK